MSDPQALHAEIMAYDEADVILTPVQFLNEVKAALELHKPEPCGFSWCSSPDTHRVCAQCGRSVNWPCQTVKVIAAALGVTTDG
jgi:hypothetical protein